MTTEKNDYVTRESVLKLLSHDEVAKVSTAEAADHLSAGDEYLDLEHLEHGVQRAGGTPTPMGHVLPRKAVHENTWTKILMLVKPASA
jgi:hypothetical protein